MEQPPYTEDELSTTTTVNSPQAIIHQNSDNSRGGTRHPVYRGVRKRRWGKWVSEIREPRKKSRIWLGSFPIPEMAAKAYDVAAYCLKGCKAQLNFPDEVDNLPKLPSTCTARDIQEAAAKAAQSMKNSNVTNNGLDVDGDGDRCSDDDFWDEIELPELINSGLDWSSCGWTFAAGNSTWQDMSCL